MTKILNKNESVDITKKKGFWKRIISFFGPAYLISVGYMDPGNWATDIAGGSKYGYTLLWVLLLSNMIALLFQSLSSRLGIVSRLDLAQISRSTYSKPVNFVLYILAELAIAATDLAEVLGMAIGLQLLFKIPLIVGVSITVLDTFILLLLQKFGIRKLEAFIITLIAVIGLCFVVEIYFAAPDWKLLLKGFKPNIPDNTALYIAIGIIGATVMPHNLYLHSALVQSRKIGNSKKSIQEAIKVNIIDSAIALNLAFFVNASILILAASTFYKNGIFYVEEIQDTYKFLAPILNTRWAQILFAIALIAAGQSSTLTGTLSGQVVMEGYLNIRLQPWIRRLITRLLAVIPALLVIYILGEEMTGELLILSQVILSLQLGFAVIPMIHFVSNKKLMKGFNIDLKTKIIAWIFTLLIVFLNLKLVLDEIYSWINIENVKIWIYSLVLPIIILLFLLLIFITIKPILPIKIKKIKKHSPHKILTKDNIFIDKKENFNKIIIALDFSEIDIKSINNALLLGGKEAEYILLHVVESAAAKIFGSLIEDTETKEDKETLDFYANSLNKKGYKCKSILKFGNPRKEIPLAVLEFNADLLIIGSHGHKLLKDILYGTIISSVRHKVKIPVLIVK